MWNTYAESSLNSYRPHHTLEDTRRVTVKYNSVHVVVYSYSPSTFPPSITKISHLMAPQIPELTPIETSAVSIVNYLLSLRDSTWVMISYSRCNVMALPTRIREGTKIVKPVLSLDRTEARRRVYNLYKLCYRHIPYISKHNCLWSLRLNSVYVLSQTPMTCHWWMATVHTY